MKTLLLAVCLSIFSFVSTANATVYIWNDGGGIIEDFVAKYKALKASHEPVIIEGYCASACTMVLMLPRSQVCVYQNATLGFHSAYIVVNGKPVISKAGAAELSSFYPPAVRKWFYSVPLSISVRWRRATDFFPLCQGWHW